MVPFGIIRVAILFLRTVNSFMNYLLQVNTNTASSYLPVVIQIIFAAGLVAFLMFITHLLGPKRKTTDKL